jgi:hypothetical protein
MADISPIWSFPSNTRSSLSTRTFSSSRNSGVVTAYRGPTTQYTSYAIKMSIGLLAKKKKLRRSFRSTGADSKRLTNALASCDAGHGPTRSALSSIFEGEYSWRTPFFSSFLRSRAWWRYDCFLVRCTKRWRGGAEHRLVQEKRDARCERFPTGLDIRRNRNRDNRAREVC